MSVISQTQSITSFVTSLNRLVTYLSFSLCWSRTFFCNGVSAIRLELLGLTNNNDLLFDFLRKNNVLFDFGSNCVHLAMYDCIFLAKSQYCRTALYGTAWPVTYTLNLILLWGGVWGGGFYFNIVLYHFQSL